MGFMSLTLTSQEVENGRLNVMVMVSKSQVSEEMLTSHNVLLPSPNILILELYAHNLHTLKEVTFMSWHFGDFNNFCKIFCDRMVVKCTSLSHKKQTSLLSFIHL